jgi:hypothetical protein
MAIVKERVVDVKNRELLLVGDTVKLIDSPLDRLKKGAKGRITAIHGDLTADPLVLVTVQFKVAGKSFSLLTGAPRFVFCKHIKGEPLPDAENQTPLTESDEEA